MTWESCSRIGLLIMQLLLVYCIGITGEPALLLCFASLLAHVRTGLQASYVRLLLSSYMAFFLVGVAIYDSFGYIYDSTLLLLTSASILAASPLTLIGSQIDLNNNDAQAIDLPGFHIFVGVIGLAIILLYFPFGLSNVDRIEAQTGNGFFNLIAQALGVLSLFSSSHRPLLTKLIMLALSCALFATFSVSRSSALLAVAMYMFINHPLYIPKKIIVIAGGFISLIFVIIASIRSIGNSLVESLRHAISDPLASHAYFYEYQRTGFLLGEYVASYFYRLVPRVLWEDKPDVIGFGRAVALSDNTRTPGLVVEGFANFGQIGAVTFPLVAGIIFIWALRRFYLSKSVYWRIFFALLCFDLLAFGRTIVTKVPYTLIENLIITIIAAVFISLWANFLPSSTLRLRRSAYLFGARNA